ncbi:gliding motility protein [Streptomyces gardneri]|nr:gliding motility protein [Streptomyces gardneri]
MPEAGTADTVDGAEGRDGSADVDAAEGVDTDERAGGSVASEVVEIPKQQSAEAAADNEAGEGARK